MRGGLGVSPEFYTDLDTLCHIIIQEVDYYFTWLVFDVQPIVWSDVHLFSPSYRQ